MDTTQQASKRSIAEIIGWRILDGEILEGDEHDGCCTLKWVDPTGEEWDLSCEPPEVTVDDMLAWLRAEVRNGYRFYDISAWRSNTTQPKDMCSVSMVRDERWDTSFHGSTLHEALELAVRACAEGAR